MKSKKGGILIITIVFTTAAMLLCLSAYLYSAETLQLRKNDIISKKESDSKLKAAFERVIKQEKTPLPLVDCYGGETTICLRSGSKYSEIEDEQSITGILLKDPAAFPQFDMEEIFSVSDPCPKLVKHSGITTFNGGTLTNQSALEGKTCIFVGGGEFGGLRQMNNIFSDSVLYLKGERLASTGYIQILGTLQVDKDFFIFAAGDIIIEKLLSLNTPNITIVSTTGIIDVRAIEGTPKLKTISRLGNYIKGSYLPQVTKPSLPLLKNAILSIGH